MPQSVAEAERALVELDIERRAVQAYLDALPDAGTLLEAAAPDVDFDRVEGERRHGERRLARLDVRERELLQRANELAEVERQAAGRGAAAAARVAAEAWGEAAAAEIAARVGLQSAAAQLTLYGLHYLPTPTGSVTTAEIRRVVDGFRSLPEPPAFSRPQTYGVMFLRAWRSYVTNDRAGLSVAEGWAAVDEGAAVWTDARRAPPHPRPRLEAPPPPDANGRIQLRFARAWQAPPFIEPAYAPGSVAELPAALAKTLVRAGFAEFMQEGGR